MSGMESTGAAASEPPAASKATIKRAQFARLPNLSEDLSHPRTSATGIKASKFPPLPILEDLAGISKSEPNTPRQFGAFFSFELPAFKLKRRASSRGSQRSKRAREISNQGPNSNAGGSRPDFQLEEPIWTIDVPNR